MVFRIREAREKAGYSQKELAQIIGVAQNTFHGYESGKHDPKSDLLIKIAQACDVTVDFLLGCNVTDDTKKSPSTAEAAPGEDALKLLTDLNNYLVNRGYIGEDDDLTDQQLDVLLGICTILRATFEQKE